MSKAVVIFSGGQDSTTCLLWALKKFDEVHAITFAYGQRHSIEVVQARRICERLKVKQVVVNVDFLNGLVESALLNGEDVNKTNEKGLPASFVPNRNQLFITLAHAYAQKIKAKTLVTGVCQTDYSGYPDCRQEYIIKIEKASNLGSDSDINIETPLMMLTKAETFKLAHELGELSFVVEFSHTCYNGNRSVFHPWGYGCGECAACQLRKKGYEEFEQQQNAQVE